MDVTVGEPNQEIAVLPTALAMDWRPPPEERNEEMDMAVAPEEVCTDSVIL